MEIGRNVYTSVLGGKLIACVRGEVSGIDRCKGRSNLVRRGGLVYVRVVKDRIENCIWGILCGRH
jgi:hypothetical protein